jgi:hypothetical protein
LPECSRTGTATWDSASVVVTPSALVFSVMRVRCV